MVPAVILVAAAAALFWLAYYRPRPRRWLLPRPSFFPRGLAAVAAPPPATSDGGETRARFAHLLRARRDAEIERELQPGPGFSGAVLALVEVGTPEAGRLLERQLSRPIGRTPAERAWCRADIVAGLRLLNHAAALPAVLRCAAESGGAAGATLAVEAVGFPGFAESLGWPRSPLGASALRALVRAARGARDGLVEPAALVRAEAGHLLASPTILDAAPNAALAEAVTESERLFRRLGAWSRLLPSLRGAADQQALALWHQTERRQKWLAAAPARLMSGFADAPDDEKGEILASLYELRADVAGLFPQVPDAPWRAAAVRALTWSESPAVGPMLADEAEKLLKGEHDPEALVAVLAALKGHRSEPAEAVLLLAAGSREPAVRRAACSALGWWDGFDVAAVVACGEACRKETDPGIRSAGVGLLARLGERSALREFRNGLAGEEAAIRQLTALRVAEEGVSWLWPDLTALADTADPDTAVAAAEACERMREDVLGFAG